MYKKKFGPFNDSDVDDAFKSFDLDGNEYIGAAELRQVYNAIGEVVTDEEIDEMIRMVDSDGDGQISAEEFSKMIFKYAERSLGSDEEGKYEDDLPAPTPSNKLAPIERAPTEEKKEEEDKLYRAPPKSKLSAFETQERRNEMEDALQHLHMTGMDVNQLMKRFTKIDKDNSGTISYKEFCKVLKIEAGVYAERAFTMFDGEGNGTINMREFLVGMANYTSENKEDKIAFAFKVFDINHDGFISKPELLKILKANYMASSEKQVEKKADAILRTTDKNGDGKISFDEFVNVCELFPNLLFPTSKMNTKLAKLTTQK